MASDSPLMSGMDGISMMGLQELAALLLANKQVTLDVIDAIEFHAAALSKEICDDFTMLNAIVTRHEAILSARWQINQEDLVTAKALPAFLNARGRMRPWEFAAIELEFSPILKNLIKGCADNNLCETLMIEFTESTDPKLYGKLNRSSNAVQQRLGDKRYRICARRAFLALIIQQRILAFLLVCTKSILHDKKEIELLQSPMVNVQHAIETVRDTQSQQKSFTSVLKMAPYRGWDSLNFAQLRGYVESSLTKQRSHIWALREDPGYFADTIREHREHLPFNVPGNCGCHYRQPEQYPQWMWLIVQGVLWEAYDDVNSWNYLKERLEMFEQLLQEGATKQQQARHIIEFREMTAHFGSLILRRLSNSYRATPECRMLFMRVCETQEYHRLGVSCEQQKYLDLMKYFHTTPKPEEHAHGRRLDILLFALESVDYEIRTNKTAQMMVTGRILDLLTDLSIITECARQASLWTSSPEIQTGEIDGCGCNFRRVDRDGVDFHAWKMALGLDFKTPMRFILPLKDKLNYPEHKKHTPTTTAAMRKAERNLDLFWGAIDSHFEAKTGLAQHRVIKDCLGDSHKMHRTVPWEQRATTTAKVVHSLNINYQPISNDLHNQTLQITGNFDRMSIVDKIKPKTRGIDNVKPDSSDEVPEQSSDTDICFKVKKQTYKVFRTLLHAASLDDGDVAKQVKWADFIKAMGDMGFAVEKLQGSAWQFIPDTDVGGKRSIQFHEPHPVSDITPVIASRMGRRLNRVYGWNGDMFSPA